MFFLYLDQATVAELKVLNSQTKHKEGEIGKRKTSKQGLMPVSSPHVTAKSVIIIIESKLDNYNSVFLQYRVKKC